MGCLGGVGSTSLIFPKNCHNPNDNTTTPQHNRDTVVGFDLKWICKRHPTIHHRILPEGLQEPHMCQNAKEISFAVLGITKKFMVILQIFRSISGSGSCSILLSLVIVPRYIVFRPYGVSQKCPKMTHFGHFWYVWKIWERLRASYWLNCSQTDLATDLPMVCKFKLWRHKTFP